MNTEEKNFRLSSIQTDVGLLSLMTVVGTFFVGALLPKFNTFDLSIKIPISFLIISTFGFLFSALIIANATSKILANDEAELKRHLHIGYAISEYVGIYLFILSVPLIISIITDDIYLRSVTFLAAIIGIGLYQFMGFSLLNRYFPKNYNKYSVLTILFGVALFCSQIYVFHFTLIASIFLAFILAVTIVAPIKEFK